ncbi:MAG TPA: DUF4126 family protein [Candidatus Eremiobacteraceae bacterium]|nr:DUF4126 family protein [Candidatus Eremiobacteraceae bacterium]
MDDGTLVAIGHALLIGIVAGLRTMIAPTAVAYARNSSLWILFAVLALIELVGDKLPKVPARTSPLPLFFRCLAGGASAYFLTRADIAPWFSAGAGVVGALIGAYGGYGLRRLLTRSGRLPDIVVALGEDIVTIALALVAVRQA